MASNDDQLFRMHCTWNHANDVGGATNLAILHNLHAHLQCVATSDSILKRQPALPTRISGNRLALHAAHDLCGCGVTNRLHWNLGKADRFGVAACGGGVGWIERRGWIARLIRRKNGAALYAGVIGPSTCRPHFPLVDSGICGVGVDDQRCGARFFCKLRLVTAEISTVARQYHLARAVNAHRLELGKVRLGSVVGVDDARGHIAGGAVRIPSEGEARVRGGRIFGKIALHGWKRNDATSIPVHRWRNVCSTNNFYKRLGCLRQKRVKFFNRGGDSHFNKRTLNAGDFAQVAIGTGNVRFAAQ